MWQVANPANIFCEKSAKNCLKIVENPRTFYIYSRQSGGGIQRPIEPCLRFSGFQRRLFLCIPAQTRDYNTVKTGIPGFIQSQIEPWLKLNVFGIGIFPGKNRFSNTARIRLLLNTAQSQIEPYLNICLWIPPRVISPSFESFSRVNYVLVYAFPKARSR
jgi:hypothetical protein